MEVPEVPLLLKFERPMRNRCTQPDRPGRKRVYCQNMLCYKLVELGQQAWTWLERALETNSLVNKRGHPRHKATHQGVGMAGVCISCATEWPEGYKEGAVSELALNKQYKLYRKDAGGPPDYPWNYHEPGTDLRGDLDPLCSKVKRTEGYKEDEWYTAREDALDSGGSWPPVFQTRAPWWYGPDGAQWNPTKDDPTKVVYPQAPQVVGKGPEPKKRANSAGAKGK